MTDGEARDFTNVLESAETFELPKSGEFLAEIPGSPFFFWAIAETEENALLALGALVKMHLWSGGII